MILGVPLLNWQEGNLLAKTVILCVDDEEIPRTFRKLILLKQGYEVVTASSGEQALEMLSDRHFDLVLTDQMMPGMLGTELTKRIKSSIPSMPVVIISAVNELPVDVLYADRFISKIEGPEALFQGLVEVLERYRRAESEEIS
jgi:CheY-like chemotaxis protein